MCDHRRQTYTSKQIRSKTPLRVHLLSLMYTMTPRLNNKTRRENYRITQNRTYTRFAPELHFIVFRFSFSSFHIVAVIQLACTPKFNIPSPSSFLPKTKNLRVLLFVLDLRTRTCSHLRRNSASSYVYGCVLGIDRWT